jgi:hypothetical protein
MAGLVPAIDVLGYLLQRKTWMPATDIGITLCEQPFINPWD